MASGTFGQATRQVCLLYDVGTVAGLSEGQIFERFRRRRDEAAFAALVERHGPMVLAVCRRTLRDEHAAEDAFQATFLLLVRRSKTIRAGDSLGPWLHRVACRVAASASRTEAKRRAREVPSSAAVEFATDRHPTDHELRLTIHQALDELPEKYRAAVILCDLEGRTHDEAARSLRWPIGSVKGRLSRARQLLKTKLIRSGLAPAAIGVGVSSGSLAAVPTALASKTIEAASGTSAGSAGITGSVPVSTVLLVEEALRIMLWTKMKTLAAGLVAACLLAAGAGVLARQELRTTSGRAEARSLPRIDDRPKTDLDRLQGRWELQQTTFRGGIGGGGGMTGPGISAGQALEWISIRGNQLYGTDEEGKPTTPRTLTLDASNSPKRFEWRRKSLGRDVEVTKGIYKLDAQTFMICYDIKTPQQPPTDFSSEGESTKVFSTYQRDPLTIEPDVDEKRELAKLQGNWIMSASERNGEDKAIDRDAATRLTIEGSKARYSLKRVPGTGGMGGGMGGMGGGMGGIGGGMGGMGGVGGGMGGMGGGMGGMGGARAATKGVDQRFAVNEYVIRLDMGRSPRVMELRPPRRPSLELRKANFGVQALRRTSYKIEGDTLITCVNNNNFEDAPAEFVTRPGDGRFLSVFVRDLNPPTSTEAPPRVTEVTTPTAPTPVADSKSSDAVQVQRDALDALEKQKDRETGLLDLGELEQEALRKQIRDLEDSIAATVTARVTNFSRGPIIGGDSPEARERNLEQAKHLLSQLKTSFLDRKHSLEGNRREIERLVHRIDTVSIADSHGKPSEVSREFAALEAKLDRVISELEALKRRVAETAGPKPSATGERD